MAVARKLTAACLVLSLCLFGRCAFAQFEGENLLVTMPSGFKVGYQDARNGVRIQELIPAGETVQNWSEMVTVQVFQNRTDLDPRKMLERIRQQWLQACRGSAPATVVDGQTNGYTVATMLLRCPMNGETGKPETTSFRAIKGRDSFYMVQRAVRFVPDQSQLERMNSYLATVSVCDTRKPQHPCPDLRGGFHYKE